MPSLKEYNKKLLSLRNTRKTTKTMKMVSATKFHRALEAFRCGRDYAAALEGMLASAQRRIEADAHPLLAPRPRATRALVLVITSDRGLCGAFNNNVHRHLTAWVAEQAARYPAVDLSCCSRRATMHFRNYAHLRKSFEGVTAHPGLEGAQRLAADVTALFLERPHYVIYVAVNQFINPLSQKPSVQQLLPVHADPAAAADDAANVITEPDGPPLLEALAGQVVQARLFRALLENAAGEHAARMTAMDSATNNADKMIRHYTLLRNRARQAGITREMIEIVTGAQALE